jgi:pyruvate formate lyase activating enzyme
MIVGGFQPFTLSDFPGRMAAILFTQGCNFRCPFCHNGSLIPLQAGPGDGIPESTILDFLQKRRGQLDGLVVTGGEPTIQTGLLSFLRRVKGMGFRIKLDTNGSRPEVLRDLLAENLLDFIAMDVKAPWDLYDQLAGVHINRTKIEECIRLVASCGVEHEYRTTYVEPLLSPEAMESIRGMIPTGSPHRIQTFQPANALDPRLRSH